jgi:hypothetical protein
MNIKCEKCNETTIGTKWLYLLTYLPFLKLFMSVSCGRCKKKQSFTLFNNPVLVYFVIPALFSALFYYLAFVLFVNELNLFLKSGDESNVTVKLIVAIALLLAVVFSLKLIYLLYKRSGYIHKLPFVVVFISALSLFFLLSSFKIHDEQIPVSCKNNRGFDEFLFQKTWFLKPERNMEYFGAIFGNDSGEIVKSGKGIPGNYCIEDMTIYFKPEAQRISSVEQIKILEIKDGYMKLKFENGDEVEYYNPESVD